MSGAAGRVRLSMTARTPLPSSHRSVCLSKAVAPRLPWLKPKQKKGILTMTVHVTSDPGESHWSERPWLGQIRHQTQGYLLKRPLLSQESRTARPQNPSSSMAAGNICLPLMPHIEREQWLERQVLFLPDLGQHARAQRSEKTVDEAETEAREL